MKQHCNVKLVQENACEGWSQPEPLGTRAAFGKRGIGFAILATDGKCWWVSALRGSAPTWVVGSFCRTLEPAWDWCLVPESQPGMFKCLPMGGWQRTKPLLAPVLPYLDLPPTLFPLRWKKEVICFWGAFAPDVWWWQHCLYHYMLCFRTGGPRLCLPASAAGDPVPSSCPVWPPLLAALLQEEGVNSPPQLLGAGSAASR